jgi:hypothetical protein
MPARTILDDTLAETAADKERLFDDRYGEQRLKEWGRGWIEAKRRGGEDKEANWYANNRRYR